MTEMNDVQRRLARVRKLATLLDDKYKVPGTRIRFGADSLVGLIPGIGDAASAIAGMWLIGEAYRLGASWSLVIRMSVNLILDSTLGAIPIIGDIFDLFWKSNRRNAKLLEAFLSKHRKLPQ